MTPYGAVSCAKHIWSRALWGCSGVISIQRKICTFTFKMFTFSQNDFLSDAFIYLYSIVTAAIVYSIYARNRPDRGADGCIYRWRWRVDAYGEISGVSMMESGVFLGPEITSCHPLCLKERVTTRFCLASHIFLRPVVSTESPNEISGVV